VGGQFGGLARSLTTPLVPARLLFDILVENPFWLEETRGEFIATPISP